MSAEITVADKPEAGPGHETTLPNADVSGSSNKFAAVEFDKATEKRLLRKLDNRLVLLAFLCYMAAFLDRSNIGNAQTAGMGKDLGYDEEQYDWLLTIFYIPYIVFEWLALMWKIIPPHIWACVTVFTWGLASMLQAAASNWQGLMACRFFLALAEAGFGPGMPYLLSFFYNRRELGLRCGFFLSAAPLATTFAGALAYGITSGQYSIASWRLLFIVEAIPPLALAVAVYFLLPDSIATSHFLTEEEKALARARSLRTTGAEDSGTSTGFALGHLDLGEVVGALKTPQAWVNALMYFSCNVAFASLPVFLPAILKGMGFTAVHAQGLTAPPYFLAFLVCIATTWLADRLQQRAALIGGLSLLGAAGYALLAAAPARALAARYLGVWLAAAGVFPAIANILAWMLTNQRGDARRGAGIALMNVVGQCGPLLGTRVFPARHAPRYVPGMAVCAAFMLLNAVLTFGLRAHYKRANARWDRDAAAAGSSAEKVDVPSAGMVEHPEPGGWEKSSAWRYAL